MRLDPRLQPSATEDAGGDLKDRLLGHHGRVPDPLVAIHEWMVLDQGEIQRRGLLAKPG